MGDAINCYVLGRIRLEHQNGWDDICMTNEYKAHIAKFYKLYRAISVFTAYGFAYILLCAMQTKEALEFILPTAIAGCIHFLLALRMIVKGLAPIIPQYKKRGLIFRVCFVFTVPAIWWFFMNNYIGNEAELYLTFTTSILYFIMCGMMHPLPTRSTLLESVVSIRTSVSLIFLGMDAILMSVS